MNKTEEFLINLRELVSDYVYDWQKCFDNSYKEFWWDDRDRDRNYEEHPAYNYTFDECIISLRDIYKFSRPNENYTLEEYILSRIEDNSDK